MPLTEQQRSAIPHVRAHLRQSFAPSTTAVSVEERAKFRDPAQLSLAELTARVEIAAPLADPLLSEAPLRAPSQVPVFFFALRNEGEAPAPTHVIFFVHGGANVIGHPTELPWVRLYATLLRAAGGRCILAAPSYRLATVPENAFPAALQDVAAAYDHVVGIKGYDPANIVLVGDSAGGNHVLVLTHLLLRAGRPPPRGVVPIAPFSIQAHDLVSEYAKAQAHNDVIDTSETERLVKTYIGDSGMAPTDPLISGSLIPFDASWPTTLILVGSADQVIDGSRVLAKRLTEAQRQVELIEYDERPHAWWVLDQIFPEDIQDAAQRIAQLVRSD